VAMICLLFSSFFQVSSSAPCSSSAAIYERVHALRIAMMPISVRAEREDVCDVCDVASEVS